MQSRTPEDQRPSRHARSSASRIPGSWCSTSRRVAGSTAAEPRSASASVRWRVAIALHPGRRYRIGKLVARPQVIDALGLRGGEWFDAGTLRTALDRARRQLARRLTVKLSVAGESIDLEVK